MKKDTLTLKSMNSPPAITPELFELAFKAVVGKTLDEFIAERNAENTKKETFKPTP